MRVSWAVAVGYTNIRRHQIHPGGGVAESALGWDTSIPTESGITMARPAGWAWGLPVCLHLLSVTANGTRWTACGPTNTTLGWTAAI